MKKIFVIDIAGNSHQFSGTQLCAKDHAHPSLALSIYEGDRRIAQFSQFTLWKEITTES